MSTYVAIANKISSSYQLLSLVSYVLANNDNIAKTYAVIDPYWHSKQIPERYLNFCKQVNVELVHDYKQLPNVRALRGNGFKVLRFYVNDVSLKSVLTRQQDRAILIADGLGTYTNYRAKIDAVTRERGRPNFKVKRKILSYMLQSKVAELFPSVKSYMMYRRTDLKLNNEFVDDFINLVKKLKADYSNVVSNYSIFISQPLVELGLLSEFKYMDILKGLKQRAADNNLKFIVKPHPAEKTEWYERNHFLILKFDGVVEEFAINNPDNEYLSMLSSALLTLPNFGNSRVMRIPVNELDANMLLSNKQRHLLYSVPSISVDHND